MRRNILIPLLIALAVLVSCEEKDMKWINAKDPQADSAAITEICEKNNAECGYIKAKADDGKFHSIFCGEKCVENYSCNYSNNKCEAMKRNADCDPKPENSVWNDMGFNGTFVQTWDGTEWVPATHEAAFGETPGECVFQCYAGFYWNDDSCEREPIRNAYCYGLPENAEWNTVSEITQTWNGEEYVPSIEGTFNEEASTTECRFKCISGAKWTGSRCELISECSPTSATPCKDSSSGLIWSAKASSDMTWQNAIGYCKTYSEDGLSGWHLPTISELRTLIQNCPKTETGGSCGVTDSCLSYSNCRNDACSGCSSDSSGKYSKLGDSSWLWSSSVLSDDSDYAWYVHFYAGDVISYGKNDYHYVRCVMSESNIDTDTDDTDTDTEPDQTNPCDSNPCNNVANSDGICTEHGIADYSCGCNEHYIWNSSTLKCELETQTFYCVDKPENSSWNSVSSYTQTWNGTDWIPAASNTSYNETASSTECRFKCNSGYEWDGTKCKLKELPECSSESATPCKDSSSGLVWSAKASSAKTWQNAINYCNSYSVNGLSSWHLPNIDELRTLLIASRVSANCQVSEINNCLSTSCTGCESCSQTATMSAYGVCSAGQSFSDGRYSKLGDSGVCLWSSSSVSNLTDNVWDVRFSSGEVAYSAISSNNWVRCVRKWEK